MSGVNTLEHLEKHHRDFGAFRDEMVKSAVGRFDATFWATFEQWLAPKLDDGELFVDFGTGPGTFLELLFNRRPNLRIAGVDCQPEMIASARQLVARLGSGVRLVEEDLAQPPLQGLQTASAAAGMASMLLHEMPIPTKLLLEVHRVLRPGGRLLLYDWVRHPLRQYDGDIDPRADDGVLLDTFEHFGEHCRWSPEDLIYLGERCGFATLDVSVLKNGRRAMLLMEARG